MEAGRAIPEGAVVRIRLGGEIEVATVVKPGKQSMRVRLEDGSVIKRKIERDLVEVLDGRGEEASDSAAEGCGVGDED